MLFTTKLLELKAKLTTDFTPYGDGLSGQAAIEDSSGRLNVHVQILRVSKENKTRFRSNTVVVLKGTFRKFCMCFFFSLQCSYVAFQPP